MKAISEMTPEELIDYAQSMKPQPTPMAVSDVIPCEKAVTSVDDIMRYQKGTKVELSPFGPGMPMIATLRRPSMMLLLKNGKIPNSLMDTAYEMFFPQDAKKQKKESEKDSTQITSEIWGIMQVMAEATLVSPSWAELTEAGVMLTDDQMTEIFNYAMSGVTPLNSFLKKPESIKAN